MATDRQIEANRSNATHSTGPVTDAGKTRSSSNALKHAFYAAKPGAIRAGPMAEDDDGVNALIDAMALDLAPRTPLECQQALRIATCYRRLDQRSRYETTHLDSSSGPYRLGEFLEGVSKLDARASSALSTAPARLRPPCGQTIQREPCRRRATRVG
jgi:hypothetical protein